MGTTPIGRMMDDTTIFKDLRVPLIDKIWHIHKIGKRPHRDWTKIFGDIPVVRYNATTDKFERVENPRGRAYAARRRRMYRKRKKY